MGKAWVPIKEVPLAQVVGLFEGRAQAERAIDHLLDMGYHAEDLGYLVRERDESGQIVVDGGDIDEDSGHGAGSAGEEAVKGVSGGAVGGAAVGAGAGLLASAGMLLVPGIGPFLAAGTLTATMGGAVAGGAGGAVLGGAAGAIFGAVTEDDADQPHEISAFYREGVERGKALVTIDVADDEAMEAVEMLRSIGAHKADVYGETGWVT